MDKLLENKFLSLFARKLSGDASAEELEQLEEILQQHTHLRFFYNELMKPRSANDIQERENAEAFFTSHKINMQLQGLFKDEEGWQEPSVKKNKPQKWGYLFIVAASVAVIIAFSLLWRRSSNIQQRPYTTNETATTKGSKSTVKLPDGTVVMLNSKSKLQYGPDFTSSNRVVTLEGEAYFDVFHDIEHPFIIHTKKADIRVLGTAFNVKALQTGYFETALIRGKVAIYFKNQSEGTFVLKPGEKLVSQNEKTESEPHTISSIKILPIVMKDSVIAETSWTKNQLVCVNKQLMEIATDLEQVFDTKIVFKTDKTKQYRYTGVYDETNLTEIFDILNFSRPFNYNITKDSIIIE